MFALEKWSMLPELRKRVAKDAKFGEWVLLHLDGTTGPEALLQIHDKATKECPRGCGRLCARIAKRAKAVLEDIERTREGGGAEAK